jgi:heme-degrading monooxygenase HmoA
VNSNGVRHVKVRDPDGNAIAFAEATPRPRPKEARSMIARLGHFDSFDMTDREYVVEAIKDRPGFRGVYHLVDRESGRALSISFFDSEEDAGAAQRAVGAAREAGGHGGPSPDLVETWEVVRHAR